jgi:hypothetical protein
MLPVYKALLASKPAPRILVYSGDVDGCIPHTGTRRWIAALGLSRAKPRRAWHSGTGEHYGKLPPHSTSVASISSRPKRHCLRLILMPPASSLLLPPSIAARVAICIGMLLVPLRNS